MANFHWASYPVQGMWTIPPPASRVIAAEYSNRYKFCALRRVCILHIVPNLYSAPCASRRSFIATGLSITLTVALSIKWTGQRPSPKTCVPGAGRGKSLPPSWQGCLIFDHESPGRPLALMPELIPLLLMSTCPRKIAAFSPIFLAEF